MRLSGGLHSPRFGSLISGRVRSDSATSRNILNMADGKLVTMREWRLAIAFCAVMLCVGEPAQTQEPSRPADALSPSPPSESASRETRPAVSAAAADLVGADKRSPLDALPTSIRFLPNKLGDLVPVPVNATLEGYFEYVKNLAAIKRETAPAATVSSIELTGDADDERATFNVRLIVRLRQANEFVQVPLQLNEAVLIKPAIYTGDGQEISGEKDRDRGFVWWFRGVGPHQLDLSLSVPIRKQLPTRRLQLSLPASAVAKLKLTVPHRAATVKAGEQTPLEVSPLEGGQTQIEAFGLGSRIDLSWQPTPEASPTEPSLEANTTILARVDTDAVLLDVEQRVQALQGTFDSFAVLLPTGAEILKIEGDDYREHRLDPNQPGRVIVSLTKASVGPVRLRWTVRLPGAERRRLQLDGFVVEGARKQSGEIGLAPQDGLRLSQAQQNKDANILRIDAGELRTAAGAVQATRAYRFLTQPFSLVVGVEPIEAYYLVEPKLFLSAAVHQLSLDAALQYQVYGETSLSEVMIHWPDWKAEGWMIDGLDPPDLVKAASLEEDRNSIRVRLVERQSGAFQIRLRARRAIKGTEDVALTLPRARASSPPTVSLIVVNAENVETELAARGETVLRPMLPATPEQIALPEPLRGLKWAGYRLDTDEQSFSLRIAAQQRRLRIESSSEAAWQNDRVQVVQRIACDVAYERMSQLKLKVPRELPTERVRFFTDRDVELTPEWTEEADPQLRLVRLALPEPKIGRFEIQVRFFVRVPDDASTEGDSTLAIPIVQSGEEPFSQTRFALARTDWFEAAAVAEIWKPQPLRPEAWLWSVDGTQPGFELRMTRSRGAANGTASVSRGLITAKIERSGQGQFRAQFRIASRSSSLNMTLPLKAELSQVVWDRTPLTRGVDAVELPAGSRKFTLRLPELNDGAIDHLLTIDYQMPCGADAGWTGSLELLSPQLPQSSWVAQVVWQAVLPADQHVFTYPSSATPMFRWRRQGVFWYRVSDPDPSQLRQWIGAASGPPTLTAGDADSSELSGNLYAFSQFGAPRALAFLTLSRPMVVLFGASLSLLAGFAILRVPALRHALTVLFAGLLLAIIGLWHAAPLELLLQPMIAGLALPTVAMLIEGWFRRRHGGTVLTLPTPDELSAAHANRQELLFSPNGDDPTLHRVPVHDSRDLLRTESGSGVS